jgi:hypothetical protein
MNKKILFGLSSFISPVVFGASAGDMSENLFEPTVIATRLAIFACYILGVGLILAAGVQYKQHRQSPKLTPLSTPILLLIIGIALVALPYFSTATTNSYSAIEQEKRDNPYYDPQAGRLPLPPIGGKSFTKGGDEYRREGDESSQTYDEDPDASHWGNDPDSGGDGHWSDDPDYR